VDLTWPTLGAVCDLFELIGGIVSGLLEFCGESLVPGAS
jgi:hypothetical protein